MQISLLFNINEMTLNANLASDLKNSRKRKYTKRQEGKPYPPGRIKIVNALISLLQDKEFNAITTYEIAKKAGVTEGLIYKYFDDKRDLLHQVLSEYLESFLVRVNEELMGVRGPEAQLKKLIWKLLSLWEANRVFAKIILIEVRSFPGYYESETYEKAKKYSRLMMSILKHGIQSGKFRDDVPPEYLRQIILGAMEHMLLPALIFNLEVDPDILAENIFRIIYKGILV